MPVALIPKMLLHRRKPRGLATTVGLQHFYLEYAYMGRGCVGQGLQWARGIITQNTHTWAEAMWANVTVGSCSL